VDKVRAAQDAHGGDSGLERVCYSFRCPQSCQSLRGTLPSWPCPYVSMGINESRHYGVSRQIDALRTGRGLQVGADCGDLPVSYYDRRVRQRRLFSVIDQAAAANVKRASLILSTHGYRSKRQEE